MKNTKLKRGLLLPFLSLLLLLNSCNLLENNETESLSITGIWVDAYGGKIEVTEDLYSSYWSNNGTLTLSHKGEIVSFTNNSLNGGESENITGGYGYLVIKYDTENGGAGSGKYGILRWKSLTTTSNETTMSYSEGFNDSVYFDTEEEAISGMTNASGYFNFYSSTTKE